MLHSITDSYRLEAIVKNILMKCGYCFTSVVATCLLNCKKQVMSYILINILIGFETYNILVCMTIVIKYVILFQEAIKAYTDAVDCLDVLCYNPSLDSTSKGLLQKELVRSLRRITCCKYYLSNTKLGKSTQPHAPNRDPEKLIK